MSWKIQQAVYNEPQIQRATSETSASWKPKWLAFSKCNLKLWHFPLQNNHIFKHSLLIRVNRSRLDVIARQRRSTWNAERVQWGRECWRLFDYSFQIWIKPHLPIHHLMEESTASFEAKQRALQSLSSCVMTTSEQTHSTNLWETHLTSQVKWIHPAQSNLR